MNLEDAERIIELENRIIELETKTTLIEKHTNINYEETLKKLQEENKTKKNMEVEVKK